MTDPRPPPSTAPRLFSRDSGWAKIPPSAACKDSPESTTIRYHVCIDGRFVSVIRPTPGRIFCIDSICFHAGGPLALGDIEEINETSCLVCPWHFYHCSLSDGQKFYQQATMQDGKPMPGAWQSVGVRQRTHEVEEREDGIYVRLSSQSQSQSQSQSRPEHVESDRYAFEQETGDRIWMLSRAGTMNVKQQGPMSGGNSSPRSTPPASPRRGSMSCLSGGLGGVSSESEEVWPDRGAVAVDSEGVVTSGHNHSSSSPMPRRLV